jgi:hypothetical protein
MQHDDQSFEIQYTSQDGVKFREAIGYEQAKQLARKLAIETGSRTILRKARPRPYKLIIADLETRQAIESPHKLSKREAIAIWRDWQENQENAVLIFWPAWAPKFIIDLSA